MKKYAIVLAGGEGLRAGGEIPKQLRVLAGKPMVWWSMHAFFDFDSSTNIIVVLHPGLMSDWNLMWKELAAEDFINHTICCGGRTRAESVSNALKFVPDNEDVVVAIHDAARPMLDKELLKRCWSCGFNDSAAIPGIAVTDSIREVSNYGNKALERSKLRAIQTPQVFHADIIKDAYARIDTLDSKYTDDASVVEQLGCRVNIFEGSTENIKVTYPIDFFIAEHILKNRNKK